MALHSQEMNSKTEQPHLVGRLSFCRMRHGWKNWGELAPFLPAFTRGLIAILANDSMPKVSTIADVHPIR